MSDFLVSTKPDGSHVWWAFGEPIPDDHCDVRPATAAEAALIDRILAHDRARRMPPAGLGDRLARLFGDAPHAG